MQTRVFTPEEQERFRGDVARSRLIVLIVFGSAAAIAIAAVAIHQMTGSVFGLPAEVWIPAVLAYLLLESIVALQLWRCPSCKRGFGLEFDPTNCDACGARFK